jgi:hypothetical protein
MIFDPDQSKEDKERGQAEAAKKRAEQLDLARRAARYIAEQGDGTCTMDKVHKTLMRYYSWWNPSILGPAAGSVFKTEEWVFTGERVESAHVKNHARELKVWRLRNYVDELEESVKDLQDYWDRNVNPTDTTRTTGLSNLRYALMEGHDADTLKLAMERYMADLRLQGKGFPVGLKKFFEMTPDAPFREFLKPSYQKPLEKRRQEDVNAERPEPKDVVRTPDEILEHFGVGSFSELLEQKKRKRGQSSG